jgi:hypothetical protein
MLRAEQKISSIDSLATLAIADAKDQFWVWTGVNTASACSRCNGPRQIFRATSNSASPRFKIVSSSQCAKALSSRFSDRVAWARIAGNLVENGALTLFCPENFFERGDHPGADVDDVTAVSPEDRAGRSTASTLRRRTTKPACRPERTSRRWRERLATDTGSLANL